MPEIEAIISAKEARIAEKERELELLKAELRGMRAIADVMATKAWTASINDALAAPPQGDAIRQRGRQLGAISHQWRDTLGMLRMNYPFPEGFTEYNAAAAAQAAGLPNVRPKDALDRLTAYVSHGYVEHLSNGRWLVTDSAAEKYGFSKPRNEWAPTSEPEEAP